MKLLKELVILANIIDENGSNKIAAEIDALINKIKPIELIKVSYIKRRGKEWIVYSKKGKILGKHPSRKKALQQLRAVEWSKSKAK